MAFYDDPDQHWIRASWAEWNKSAVADDVGHRTSEEIVIAPGRSTLASLFSVSAGWAKRTADRCCVFLRCFRAIG